MTMTIDLYYLPQSPPCRAVLLTIEALGLDVNYKTLDIFSGEHLTEEYGEMNPQKTIPFIVDDNLKLSESRAIMSYLADQYGSDPNIYPTDPNSRAIVDQYLHFDAGIFYPAIANYYYPVIFKGQEFEDSKLEKLKDAFGILNKYLENKDYITGENLTIADLGLIASCSTAETLGFDLENFPNVSDWAEKVKSAAPNFETANGAVEMFREFLDKLEDE